MGITNTSITYETLRSIDSSTFSGSYLAIGTATTHPARIFKIVNNTNVTVTISIDGTNDYDVLPAGTYVLYDIDTNRAGSTPVLTLPQGTQFYAKGAAGTGLVYVVVLYAKDAPQTTYL